MKPKQIKKLASLFLALCMAVAVLPTTVFAGTGGVTGTMRVGSLIDLGTSNSGPGWVWDAAGATLTLSSGYAAGYIDIQCATTDTVNLVYSGDVVINSGGETTIYCKGNLNITGSGGTLTVNSLGNTLIAKGDLQITGGNLVCTTNLIHGRAMMSESGTCTISGDANVTAASTGGGDGWGILAQNGDVVISTTGTVAATGGNYAIGGVNGTISNGTIKSNSSEIDPDLGFDTLNMTGGSVIYNDGIAPQITAVTPTGGPKTGRTVITLMGTGFVSGSKVYLNGVAATNVEVKSETQITCTTPAVTQGTATVKVQNNGGIGVLKDAFTYTAEEKYLITTVNCTASAAEAVPGATLTVNAPAKAGAKLLGWSASGIVLPEGMVDSFTFTMPAKNVQITAIYGPPDLGVSSVTLNQTALALHSDAAPKTATLTVTVLPAEAADKNVTWQSSNTAVATVTASGLVTAVGSGTATITVTTADGGHTASCTVTVSVAAAGTGGTAPVVITPPAPVPVNRQNRPVVTPTPPPAPKATASPALVQATATPAPAASEPAKQNLTPSTVQVDEAAGTVTVVLNIADLPAGAATLKLPGGTLVEVGQGTTVTLTVKKSDLAADDTFLLTVLNENGTPLASGMVQATPTAASNNLSATFWWAAGGTAALAACAAIAYLLFKKRRGA